MTLNVLLIADADDRLPALQDELQRGSFPAAITRAATAEALAAALDGRAWDAVLAQLPLASVGVEAVLEALRARGLELPVLILAEASRRDAALAAVRAGAADFVEWDNLSRLVPALERELRAAGARRAHQETVRAQAWEAEVNAAIADLARALITPVSPDELSALVLAHAKRLTGSAFGFVGYIEPATGAFISATMTEGIWDTCQVANKSKVFERFAGLWGWVLTQRKPLLTNDPAADPRSGGTPPGHVPIRRFVGAPALMGDELVGMVALANAERDYAERDLALLERLASLYAVAVQRKRSEDNLRVSESKLDRMLQTMADGMVVVDLSGQIIYANQAAERILTIRHDGILGRYFDEREWRHIDEHGQPYPPEQLPLAIALRERREVMGVEHGIVALDGEIRWLSVNAAPLVDEAGRLYGAIADFRDVTDRRRTDEALRQSKAYAENLIESASTLIIGLDVRGVIQVFNAAAERITGYTRAELADRNWFEVLVPRERYPYVWEVFSAWQSGAEMPLTLENPILTKSGEERYISWRNSELRENGQLIGTISFGVDITDRRRAEDTLRFLFEASNLLAASLDYGTTLASLAQICVPRLADFCMITIAQAGENPRPIAVASADPAKADLAHEFQRSFTHNPKAPRGVEQVLRTGQPELLAEIDDAFLVRVASDSHQLELLRALGPCCGLIVPLTARGHVFGAITLAYAESGRRYRSEDTALAMELARRGALAVDNARLYHEAQEAVRVRDQFLSLVSHDLKTPLVSIKGSAQLLQRRLARRGVLKPEQSHAGLARIDRSATRMTALIDDLLDLARQGAGHPLSLERRPTDLVALVRRLVEDQQGTERHVIRVDARPGKLVGQWDAGRLERAFANLIENAVKYSPEGGSIVVTVAEEERPEGSWAVLTVQDEGLGIPADDLPYIFEPFQRAANVARRIGGTGLGLASVKQIVEQHGGVIEVESREGAGATFRVRLPCVLLDGDSSPAI